MLYQSKDRPIYINCIFLLKCAYVSGFLSLMHFNVEPNLLSLNCWFEVYFIKMLISNLLPFKCFFKNKLNVWTVLIVNT